MLRDVLTILLNLGFLRHKFRGINITVHAANQQRCDSLGPGS